jgi:putative tryptophan/tyrosine transport system substrate-binding protein
MRDLRRRDFITLLGGAATWPLAAEAQAQTQEVPVVGFLNHGSPSSAQTVAAFRKGLSESGYVEGRNVAIEYRWAQFDNDRLPELAADLVRRRVAVIATSVSTPASLAAKAATSTIPIVFGIGTDPVEAGLVASFNRPGGNVTGVSGMNWELTAKRLSLLHELLPRAGRFAALVNPKDPNADVFTRDVKAAAIAIGREIDIVTASSNRDIDIAYSSLVSKKADALLIGPDGVFFARRVQLIALSLRHAVPAIYPWREAIEIGGLMSYGSSFAKIFREVGIYAGRILKGEKPVDLPVLRASKFDFVINLQTAKVLGLEIPPTLLALADEVIE